MHSNVICGPRACLFAALFFLAVFTVRRCALLGVPRYDLLLVITIAIQAWMLRTKRETSDEVRAIALFYLIGVSIFSGFVARQCEATSSRPGGSSNLALGTMRHIEWPRCIERGRCSSS